MTQRRTSLGTRKLSDVARHVVAPSGITSTGYPAVQQKLADIGLGHDDWQQGLGRLILAKRPDGKYAATIGGVAMSIARQVGKTYLVGTIIIALCLLFPGLKVLWTAHRTRTSDETFMKMKGWTARKKVKPFMLPPRSANGQQEIRFRNGSRIMFGAREQGFGRGFDEVDVEVFDEAQILTEKALDDMIAATNQSRQATGALVIFMGTPPRPTDPGTSFRNKRKKALAVKKSRAAGNEVEFDAVYVEISAESNANPDDPRAWSQANPSYPDRTPVESIKRLRALLESEESFMREGLGIWDEDDSGTVISLLAWEDRELPAQDVTGPVVLAVETTLDRSASVLVAVGKRDDDSPQVEVVAAKRGDPATAGLHAGTAWVASRIVEVCLDNEDVEAVVIDDRSQAKPLIADIRAALDDAELSDVELVVTSSSDVAEACPQLLDAINDGPLAHVGDVAMTTAVKSAAKRDIGDGAWAWSRRRGGAAVAPLVAMTIGLWAWRQRVGTDYDVMASLG